MGEQTHVSGPAEFGVAAFPSTPDLDRQPRLSRLDFLKEPLRTTSWLNRPTYIGVFAGQWLADDLVAGSVNQNDSFQGGYWLGYDLSNHWGSELDFRYFYSDIRFVPEGRAGGSTRNLLAEADLLYFPWGDTRWRPYAAAGLGLGGTHYLDRRGQAVNHTGITIPIGFGVKYLWERSTAVRMDVRHHLVIGGGTVDTMASWTISWGVEVHWGPNRAAQYFPW